MNIELEKLINENKKLSSELIKKNKKEIHLIDKINKLSLLYREKFKETPPISPNNHDKNFSSFSDKVSFSCK